MSRFKVAAVAAALAVLPVAAGCTPYGGNTEINSIGAWLRNAAVQAPNPSANPGHPYEHYTSYVGSQPGGAGLNQSQCVNQLLNDPGMQFSVDRAWGAVTACDVYRFWYWGDHGFRR